MDFLDSFAVDLLMAGRVGASEQDCFLCAMCLLGHCTVLNRVETRDKFSEVCKSVQESSLWMQILG